MTAPVRLSRLRAVARLVLLAAAIALTTWGVCLIAFSGTMRGTRLGIPIAFWGVLVGYTAIRTTGAKAVATEPSSAEEAVTRDAEPPASAELVRERDEAARHEHEMRLEVMLRRELEQILRTELAGLRRDVAELRGDVLDAVDGRLRMERVEITRIIGSNLAALHDDGRIPVRAAAADVALVAPGVGPGHRSLVDDRAASVRGPWRPSGSVLDGILEPGSGPASLASPPAASSSAAPPTSTLLTSAPPTSASSTPSTSAASPAAAGSRPLEPGQVASSPPSGGVADPGRALSGIADVSSRRAGSPPAAGAEPTAGPEPAARPVSVPDLDPDVESAPLTDPAATPPMAYAARSVSDAAPEPATSLARDPFASLPRLSAFRLPDLPPGVSLGRPVAPAAEPEPTESTPAGSALAATELPAAEAPAAGPSAAELSAAEPPAARASASTAAPELAASETVAPETVAPETVAPETAAPEPAAPTGYVGRRRQADAADESVDTATGRHGAALATESPSAGATGGEGPIRGEAHRR